MNGLAGYFLRFVLPSRNADGGSDSTIRFALGGLVAMFGARLAGGCPSGHGMSGLMQLSISGFIAMAGFFGAGVLVAHMLYRKGGAQ